MNQSNGILKAIAWRPTDGDPMREATECRILSNRGIETENRKSGQREVTLLSTETWAAVCSDLGQSIPWHTRRANLLVEGIDLPQTIGAELTIGDVTLRIHGESKPCKIMDDQVTGLRELLVPNGRGGVFGQVLIPGTIRVGDIVSVARTC